MNSNGCEFTLLDFVSEDQLEVRSYGTYREALAAWKACLAHRVSHDADQAMLFDFEGRQLFDTDLDPSWSDPLWALFPPGQYRIEHVKNARGPGEEMRFFPLAGEVSSPGYLLLRADKPGAGPGGVPPVVAAAVTGH